MLPSEVLSDFGKVSVGHTGRGLRVSSRSAHAAAEGIRGPVAGAEKGGGAPEESTQCDDRRVSLDSRDEDPSYY